MKIILKIAFLSLLSLFLACEEPGTETTGGTNTVTETSTSQDNSDSANVSTETTTTPSESTNTVNTSSKKCEVTDKHYDKNVLVLADVEQQICIIANKSTADKELGDSHRVLRLMNTNDCSNVLEKTLPINRSPDFPYYLIPQTYESKNQIVAIQGFSSIYYFDVKNQKLVGPISPEFLVSHEASDAQSGMVKGLTVWGHYLLGHSVDFGNFAFDISNPAKPKPVLPVAEYPIPKTGEFNNLFVLEDVNGRYQAMIPTTDIDAGGTLFELDKLFPQALKINNTISKNVQNNRFIIFNDTTLPESPRKVVVDMFSKKRIDLPTEMANKKTGEILNWLKSLEQ